MSLWRKNVFQRRTPPRTGRRWLRCLAAGLALFGVVAMARAQIDVVALATDGFDDFDIPLINDNGTIVFHADATDGKAGVYVGNSGGYSKFAEEGTVFGSIRAATLSDQGTIAFWARTEPVIINGQEGRFEGLFVGNNPAQHLLDRPLSPEEPPIGINDDRHYFCGANSGGAYAHFDDPRQPDERIKWPLGWPFTLQEIIYPFDINSKGQIAYVIRSNGPAGYRLGRSEKPEADAPPQGGVTVEVTELANGFEAIGWCSIDGSGRVAFVGNEPGQPTGLYIASGGAPVPFLANGDGHHFNNLEVVSLSRGGQIAFKASYEPPTGQARNGIYRGLNGAADKIVANGDRVFTLGKEWEISIGNFGGRGFNNAGQVVFEGSIRSLDNSEESIDGIFVTAGAPDPPQEDPPPGTVYHWKGPSAASPSGSFNVASNWDPEGVPTVNTEKADTAVFSLDSDFTVNGPSPKSERLVILDGTVNLSVGTYEAPATSLVEPSVTIGGGGKLNLVGGSLESVHATIGWSVGTFAEAHLFNSGTVWSNQGRLNVGRSGPGHLFVANGAALRTAELRIADGADGSVVVGGGGDLNSAGSGPGLAVAVGYKNGTGTLEVEAGGKVFLRELSVGHSQTSTGLVVVTGMSAQDQTPSAIIKFGQYGLGAVTIGELGDGELRVEEGGLFEIHGDSPMKVGAISATGRVFVRGTSPSGAASTLAIIFPSPEGSYLLLGDQDGHGEFTVESGGQVLTENTEVQVGASGIGIVRIAGFAEGFGVSQWQAGTFRIGTGGDGLLEVKDGGKLTTQVLAVGDEYGSTGRLLIEGTSGEITEPSSVESSIGVFIGDDTGGVGEVQVINGGELYVTGGSVLRVGRKGEGKVLVSGFDSETTARSWFYFGGGGMLWVGMLEGHGELVVTNGARAEGAVAEVGTQAGTGVIRVKGTGGGFASELLLDQLILGDATGTGIVEVSEGGAIVVGEALSLANTLRVGTAGFLSGTGTIYGDLEVVSGSNAFTGGVISPGSSPGKLTVQGNLLQHSNSVIVIEVRGTTAGTLHDQIVVTGTADLRGTILLVFQNGYAPRTGHQLRLFDLPGGAPATLPAVQIQNLAPGFNYSLATVGGKLTLTASNNATFVPPATTLRVEALRVVNGVAELSVQSNLDFGAFGVQASNDLQSWADIGQVRIVRGAGRFMDVDSPRFSRLFYRILMKP